MKKVLFIAVAVMLVAGCGQRKAAKSQESEKASCQKENTEAVEHACCGHHGEGTCPKEAVEKECQHAAQEVKEACEQVEKAVKEAAETVKKEVEKGAEKVESEGVTVVNLGKKQDPKPIKPVPIPKK